MSEQRRRHGRIGPWRLLELIQATMPLRASMLGGGGVIPEYGPPDRAPLPEPEEELPDSNIGEREQRSAMQRERARRDLESRG
jgi:hypothetical protein